MEIKEIRKILENVANKFIFTETENVKVITPANNEVCGGMFKKMKLCQLSEDKYLLYPDNQFWCFLTIVQKTKNPYVYHEVTDIAHYTEFNNHCFDREIVEYNKENMITTKLMDLVNFDMNEFIKNI